MFFCPGCTRYYAAGTTTRTLAEARAEGCMLEDVM